MTHIAGEELKMSSLCVSAQNGARSVKNVEVACGVLVASAIKERHLLLGG